MGHFGDCHSFPKPNLCVAVIFWECLFQWRSNQFTKESAQRVARGFTGVLLAPHGLVLAVYLGEIQEVADDSRVVASIAGHLAHAVVSTCEVAALHRQVTQLNMKGDSFKGIRSHKSQDRAYVRSHRSQSFIQQACIPFAQQSVRTQLLVKLMNMVAESDVTISKTEKANPKFSAD